MKLKNLTLIMGCMLMFCTAGNAIPALQLYIEGATYDTDTDSWLLNGATSGGVARLWVIGNTGEWGDINGVHLAIAYSSVYNPSLTFIPSTTGGFRGVTDDSRQVIPVARPV